MVGSSASGLRDLLERLSPELRRRALTHPAFADTHGDSFERLEFLGDAVLGMAIAAALYERDAAFTEGDMSKAKAAAVARAACAQVAAEAGLGEAMVAEAAGAADQALLVDLSAHPRVLAALTESVIGAAFLELGYEPVAEAVIAAFGAQLDDAVLHGHDAKSALQELAQRSGASVSYELVEATGPDHDRVFTMRAAVSGEGGASAEGEGRSKKSAEQEAARILLERLEGDADGAAPARPG